MRQNYRQLASTLLLILAINFSLAQTTDIANLQQQTNYNITQEESSYSYFQTSLNSTHPLFTITVDQQKTSYLSIYASVNYHNNSTFFEYPNETHHQMECDQSSFDTCIINLKSLSELNRTAASPDVVVYFSVYSYARVDYQLMTSTSDYYDVNIQHGYRINFQQSQSGVLLLSGEQTSSYEQLVMVLTYNTSGAVGKFRVKAALNQIPSSDTPYYSTYVGVSVGAFSKILKLPPVSPNDTYYILIEGEKDTLFSMKFYDSMPSAPSININSSVLYQTSNNITYMAHTTFQNVELPLFIRLYAFSGYGYFTVNYCNGLLNAKFENINGENGQIAITPFERMNCKTKMMAGAFGLLVQNVQIKVENVGYTFGFEIQIFQGKYESKLRLGQQLYGTFLSFEESRIYQVGLPTNQVESLYISYSQPANSQEAYLSFELYECFKKMAKTQCKSMGRHKGMAKGELILTAHSNAFYYINITYPIDSLIASLSYNILMYSQVTQSEHLLPNKLYLDEIQEHEYHFYEINLTRLKDQQSIIIKNITEITIINKELNGQIIMLTSLTVPLPTYQKYLEFNADISYVWNSDFKYIVNQTTEIIYIAIKGQEQSLYYLHYTINVDADIPIRYQKLLEGTQNNYQLTQQESYKLVSFSSHIVPYTLKLSGNPSCIRYGHSLPLLQTCHSSLPSQFNDKVLYLNISNGDISNNMFKFSIYVNSGDYVLTSNHPILMGCMDACYQIVQVQLEQESNMIHQGRGLIYDTTNASNKVSNNFIQLSCQTYPCTAKVNASLPYGGQMSLFLQSEDIIQVNWMPKPLTFGNYPKKLIYQIRPWTDVNSILIFSQALQLTAFYNIVNLHELKTNILQYQFPSPVSYGNSSKGNPLRNTHLVEIDKIMINEKDCKNINNFCLVVISLYPNRDIQYNADYFNQGIGLISSNVYHYHTSLNNPQFYEDKLSMSYFSHHQSKAQRNTTNTYRVNIQPVSDCHPKIYPAAPMPLERRNPFSSFDYGSFMYKNPMFQIPSYDDLVVNASEGWVNFTILTQKACRFAVSLTNSNHQFILDSKYYSFSRQNSQLIVLYRHEQWTATPFSIETSTQSYFNKIISITALKITHNNIIVPSETTKTYDIQNNAVLTINQTDSNALFVIRVIFDGTVINVLIRKDGPIYLSNYQEHSQSVQKGKTMSYRIYTTGSINLFMTTNAQHPQVTINKNYNNTKVFSTTITTKSSPWIHINAENNQLNVYDITINNDGREDIIISIKNEQNDTLNYQKLYEGILLYDAFSAKNQYNCYALQTGFLLGHRSLVIDLLIRYDKAEELVINYKAFTDKTIITSNITVLKLYPYQARLTLQYVINENYTICFSSPSLNVQNLQYYVILNDPDMEHLLENYRLTINAVKPYEMLEVIQQGYNDDLLIELTNCLASTNDKILVGSSSILDSSVGRFNNLFEYYKDHEIIYSRLSVDQGYYYLGVKHNISQNLLQNLYTIRYQNIDKNDSNLITKWQLRDRKIVKIYKNREQNLIKIELPELLNKEWTNNGLNVSLVYTIFLMNLKRYEEISPKIDLGMLVRCPNYPDANFVPMLKEKGIIIEKKIYSYFSDILDYSKNHKAPVFQFDSKEIPEYFNLTAKVHLATYNKQNVFYHYETIKASKTGAISQSGRQNQTSPVLIVLLVLTALLITAAAAYVIYLRCKKASQSKKVAFELYNMNEQSDGNNAARREHRQSLFSSKVSNKSPKYEQFAQEVNG